jgi:outer membrane receptor protein involved in Fe transport
MSARWAGGLLPPVFLLFSAGHACPADGAADVADERARPLEHVQVTAKRREVTEFDVSAAVNQVTAADIASESPDVVAEMLRGLPGTFFQQTTPGQGIPVIRGLKGSQVLHLVDGMRLNNAFFRNAPNQYLGLVDAFATERMEVVRGASGALYGADAMGGVVHILTRTPEFDGPDWQREASLYSSYNSADDAWVVSARSAAGRSGLGISGGITLQNHSDRETGAGETLSPSGYRSEAADFKFVTDLGPEGDLMISAQALEQPSTPRIDELVPGYGQSEPASAQFEFSPNRRNFLHARYRHHGGSTWYEELELHLARQVITDDRLTQDFGSPLVTSEQNESILDGLTLQLDSTLPGGTLLTWGVEFYADDVSSDRSRLDTGTGESGTVRSRFPDGSTMDSAAAYVSSEWRPGDRLTIGGGLRYSAFDIHLPAAAGVPETRLRPDDFTGDVSLVYEFSDTLHLVGNLGRGFRPPNIFDLGTLGTRPGNRFNIANPELGPESVWSYDLGFKSAGPSWDYEVFAFYLDYADKITSVATGEFTPEGRTMVRSENRNRVTLYGVEAGLRRLLGDRLELYGVLNYTRGEERDGTGDEFPADRVPPLNGRLGVKFEPREGLSINGFLLFAAAQDRLSPRDADDPRIDPAGTPGWGTLNLRASWQASDKLQLGLKLENLGDQAYREHGSGIDAPGFNVGIWLNALWP